MLEHQNQVQSSTALIHVMFLLCILDVIPFVSDQLSPLSPKNSLSS